VVGPLLPLFLLLLALALPLPLPPPRRAAAAARCRSSVRRWRRGGCFELGGRVHAAGGRGRGAVAL
jgi:hypothetical protein